MTAVLVTPDQLAHVLAGGPVVPLVDLGVDEARELVGKLDVYRAHALRTYPTGKTGSGQAWVWWARMAARSSLGVYMSCDQTPKPPWLFTASIHSFR